MDQSSFNLSLHIWKEQRSEGTPRADGTLCCPDCSWISAPMSRKILFTWKKEAKPHITATNLPGGLQQAANRWIFCCFLCLFWLCPCLFITLVFSACRTMWLLLLMTQGQHELSPQLILFNLFLIMLLSKTNLAHWVSFLCCCCWLWWVSVGCQWNSKRNATFWNRKSERSPELVLGFCHSGRSVWRPGFAVSFSFCSWLGGTGTAKYLERTLWGCFSFHGIAGPLDIENLRALLPSPPATLQKNLKREFFLLILTVAPFWPFQTPTSDTSFSPTPGNFVYSAFRVRFYLAAVLSIWLFFFVSYTRTA